MEDLAGIQHAFSAKPSSEKKRKKAFVFQEMKAEVDIEDEQREGQKGEMALGKDEEERKEKNEEGIIDNMEGFVEDDLPKEEVSAATVVSRVEPNQKRGLDGDTVLEDPERGKSQLRIQRSRQSQRIISRPTGYAIYTSQEECG
ncbi:hypothetical protein NDU88_003344 [Pleurodeles waltl]|uniref:Uncharacterized protein n=1 Tax=Pleurodeles waltl TaxID=8319 RepID=A0AAV7W749_PLEWA|nr:hypothetical protein NDU88_003344 [Pleurodeles waltl]